MAKRPVVPRDGGAAEFGTPSPLESLKDSERSEFPPEYRRLPRPVPHDGPVTLLARRSAGAPSKLRAIAGAWGSFDAGLYAVTK